MPSPILGIIAAQNYPRITTSFESIATVSVGSGGAATAEFTSIPSTFAHLQIRLLGVRNANNFHPFMQFNNDTASGSYGYWHMLYGDGFSPNVYTDSRANIPIANVWDNTDATYSGVGVIDILDYANTNKYKTIRSLGGIDKNGGGSINFISGKWQSTSAVTSIQIKPTAGTFGQYTHIALYGIKAA